MKKWSLLLAAALIAGCTKSAPPAAPVTAPPVAPATAPSPTKEALNDQAFAQIKAQNWPEAIRLAQQAVALDANFAPARFNLGLALYRAQRYQEAVPHLEAAYQLNKAQVEPGWFLYLTLDALGQNAKAATILADLQARFPDDPDVKQAAGGGALVWPRVQGEQVLLFLGDRKLLARPGGLLEMQGYPDKRLWVLQFDDDAQSVVPDGTGARALVIRWRNLPLVDLADGRYLESVPEGFLVVEPSLYHAIWRGDLLYSGLEEWESDGHGGYTYKWVNWRIDRLVVCGSQACWRQVASQFHAGQELAVSADGHYALSQMVDGAPYILYSDGKAVHTFNSKVGLTVPGDATYTMSQEQGIVVTSIGGKPLVEWRAPAGMTRYLAWDRPGDTWYVAAAPVGQGGFIVVNSRGTKVFGGDGEVVSTFPNYLLIKQGGLLQVVDDAGKSRLTFPGTDAAITPDGRWVYTIDQSGYRAYRLP